ncbi:MAG: hypothetical protein HY301_10715 [Verrucomicrobia bacterium]|nr:hypothetical protein [Verrucomicrobiota bacterium]
MTQHITTKAGLAGATAGMLALAAQIYAVTLPYRLSPTQHEFLGAAFVVQLVGVAIAVALGIVALRGDARSRRFGFVAITIGIVVLLLAVLTTHVHSVSRLAS